MDEIPPIVYGTVRDFAGTVPAEHGIGLLTKPCPGYTRTGAAMALTARRQAAPDPQDMLNPGKVVDAALGGAKE